MDITGKQYRSETYRLLAACFYPPDDIGLNDGTLLKNLRDVLQPVFPTAIDAVGRMENIVEQDGTKELVVEYAKLFVGPYELQAPPYGSIYLDRQNRIMGDSTMAVKNMYREYGLRFADDFRELPDHIAVELEFMYYLIYKEIEGLKLDDKDDALIFAQAQKQFISSFLGPFVALLCEKIQEKTVSDFYNALADCVATFVGNDYNVLLKEQPKEPDV